ncbi:MAG: hypothetical protein IAF38_10040, partial [Bacteroidia bacterium]|nr:hypothetical protein [Bacteroidia bacterium]
NLQLIIALISLYPDIPIAASLFNENLIPHLQANHKNVTILNPAKIAAPYFVAALHQPLQRKTETNAVNKTEPAMIHQRGDFSSSEYLKASKAVTRILKTKKFIPAICL